MNGRSNAEELAEIEDEIHRTYYKCVKCGAEYKVKAIPCYKCGKSKYIELIRDKGESDGNCLNSG